ncbi:hypothetical protein CZ765_06790 [Corynebacterium casei]|nr:hypothetical protein CZ765_06790 [Corynebacterium casei]
MLGGFAAAYERGAGKKGCWAGSKWRGYPQKDGDVSAKRANSGGLSTGCAARGGLGLRSGDSVRAMGMWTTQALRARGIGRRKQARMVADGELHRVHRGIYVDGKATADSFARALTHSLADVALAGHSATQKHLGQKLTFPLELEGPRTIRGEKFQVKHTRRQTTQVVDGVRVVEPLWAARQSKYERGWLLERYYQGHRGIDKLRRDVERMRRVPRQLREFLTRCSIGADSVAEKILAEELRRVGFQVQHNVPFAGYRYDLWLKKLGILIEVDGYEVHSDAKSFVKDRWKSNDGAGLGCVVLRFSAECVRFHLKQVVAKVKEIALWIRQGRPRRDEVGVKGNPVFNWHEGVRGVFI